MVEYGKKQEINSQRCYLHYGASVPPPPPTLALCPSPASYCTRSFHSYPLVREGNFTKIIFPLLVQYVSVLRVLSGLSWPIFDCHLKKQQLFFFQPFLLPQVLIQIPSKDRVQDLLETLRNQQKDENYSV